MRQGRLLAAMAILCALTASTRAQSVTFEPDDLSRFVRNGSANTHYAINPTAGVGGGGGLIVNPGGGWGSLMSPDALSNAQGVTNKVSLDYRQGSNLTAIDVRLGFRTDVDDPSIWLIDSSHSFWLETKSFTSNTQRSMEAIGGPGGRGAGDAVTITPGEWYRLEFEIQRSTITNGEEFYNNTARWFGLGPDGTSAPILLRSSSTSVPQHLGPVFSSAPTIYGGFWGNSDTLAYDNFSPVPVPEPSAIAILSLGCLVALRRRGRR